MNRYTSIMGDTVCNVRKSLNRGLRSSGSYVVEWWMENLDSVMQIPRNQCILADRVCSLRPAPKLWPLGRWTTGKSVDHFAHTWCSFFPFWSIRKKHFVELEFIARDPQRTVLNIPCSIWSFLRGIGYAKGETQSHVLTRIWMLNPNSGCGRDDIRFGTTPLLFTRNTRKYH